MATVTGLTAERMIQMENATVIDGEVVGSDLILITRDGTRINAGYIQGPVGPAGPTFIICTSTTRPAMTPAEYGKAIYESDTKLVRIWDGARWKMQERVICTSSSRPVMVVEDEGVKIYETDTDIEFVWSGAAWLPASSNVARFADATDRASKWPSPPIGAMSYLTSSPTTLWVYENGFWTSVGPPPGSCFPWLGMNAPLNHILMFGQLLPNAQSLYPVLWTNVDVTWKRAPDLLIPDLRGRIPVGKDNMGGAASNRVTSGGSGIAGAVLGAVGGNEWMQSHNHAQEQHVGYQLGFYNGTGPDTTGQYNHMKYVSTTGNGSSQNVQPSIILNWVLKVL